MHLLCNCVCIEDVFILGAMSMCVCLSSPITQLLDWPWCWPSHIAGLHSCTPPGWLHLPFIGLISFIKPNLAMKGKHWLRVEVQGEHHSLQAIKTNAWKMTRKSIWAKWMNQNWMFAKHILWTANCQQKWARQWRSVEPVGSAEGDIVGRMFCVKKPEWCF